MAAPKTAVTEKVAEKIAQAVPTDRLAQEMQNLVQAMAERALLSLTGKVEGMAGRLTDFAAGGGTSLISAITGSEPGGSGLAKAAEAVKGGIGSTGQKLGGVRQKLGKAGQKSAKPKMTNIVESVDVGAPVRVVYNQWTRFQDFPGFMKKVESVEQESEEQVSWKAQIFWSHRTWQAKVIEQVPDKLIIWRSEGNKGYVDGAVTFHALTPDLTRVVLVLEYHPQGVVERVGNMWRAQGRRARLELKHFVRHVMTQTMLHPEEMAEDGWRGEIHDGEVVKDHETALQEEQEREEPADERAEEKPAEEPEEEPEEEREDERAEEEQPEEEPEEEEEEEEEGPQRETAEEEEEEPEEASRPAVARERSTGTGAARPVRRRREAEEDQPSSPARRRTGSTRTR
ncbi:SRPBCC family protein [Nonomuraea sp. NPDC004354]